MSANTDLDDFSYIITISIILDIPVSDIVKIADPYNPKITSFEIRIGSIMVGKNTLS
jgi:hypothetical protein